jgi:hypothetical protein
MHSLLVPLRQRYTSEAPATTYRRVHWQTAERPVGLAGCKYSEIVWSLRPDSANSAVS